MGRFLRPHHVNDALGVLATGDWTVLAGGTDHYPSRVVEQRDEDVLDITGIAALRGIADAGDHWRIGALTTWNEVIEAHLPAMFDGLKAAAREVGGAQIQNRGTIGGNLCNASPAADGVPPLMSLDASVELASVAGSRYLPLDRFILANRRTDRRSNELLTAIRVPKHRHSARATFLKLGARRYLVISIAMVASLIEIDRGTVAAARIVVGACSTVAQRLPALEAALVGRSIDGGLADLVRSDHLQPLQPIDDVRADKDYRRDAALVLVRRCLIALAGEQREKAA
ncbi:MAG: xanthine dehydrogenase family protein subunit M [Alphaproteobacteria bacterium]|nr:xanthine dehydrogenase family protein subunit M [Alphaproteobacteria bacterium]